MASEASGRIEVVDAQETLLKKSKPDPGGRGGYLLLHLSCSPDFAVDFPLAWHHSAQHTVGAQAGLFSPPSK